MSQIRKTREAVVVSLSEKRITQIEELVNNWDSETRRFVLRRLRQHKPSRSLTRKFIRNVTRLISRPSTGFKFLQYPHKLNSGQHRFKASGSQDATATWNRILNEELSLEDFQYLSSILTQQTIDTYVPIDVRETFEKLYNTFILKEHHDDPTLPRAPLILVIGGSGSGKSATVKQAIDEVFFASDVKPIIDLNAKRAEVMANQPIWKSLEEIDPALALRIERRRKRWWLRLFSQMPVIRYVFRRHLSTALTNLDGSSVLVDYAEITPNDYQTAWAGEPGNYLKKAMGNPKRLSIRHLEEAHSAFGKTDQNSSAKSQQSSLIDTANILLDEVIHGHRDCLVFATTDQPEQLDPAIYRRFVERGLIIDLSESWKKPENLKEVILVELRRHCLDTHQRFTDLTNIDDDLTEAVTKVYEIFRQRSLRITPAYVRRLIAEVLKLRGGFEAKFLDDQLLVREALKSVARNTYGSLYNKFVGQMDRSIKWHEYIGGIKNEFSEMANNALYYNIREEKGVVLSGPPGSGKTFMVRAWLGDNTDVQDLSVSISDLNEPSKPIEGLIANLEAVYDIAKMLSPSMVFFDEGDAIAPRRSQQGGNPYDKVTNKFLSIIDGESPLHKVFTVLTTNRLDILDPALIRSKRLKVLNITGHIRDEDGQRIIQKEMKGLPLEAGLTLEAIVSQAKALCATPADFAAFAEKLRTLRETEIEVTEKLIQVTKQQPELRERFVRFNYKVITGLVEGIAPSSALLLKVRQGDDSALLCLDEIVDKLHRVIEEQNFPVSKWHLQNARQQFAESPMKKGKQQLDDFLETELSEEPQVGFVIGAGANDISGVLLPIASSLVYELYPEKILVTGAVSTTANGAADMDLAVQMTGQSASEALTLVENYLESLMPDVNMTKILGEYLKGYTLHHQLLSASYNVGGPSAGFALAINTLSALLEVPVLNDFGITGAPWIKGSKTGEVGASVLIGGHQRKTEKVLQYLSRMYMPQRNYDDMEPEILQAYRAISKDVIGVRSFSALVPEVFDFGTEYSAQLHDFFTVRREFLQKSQTSAESAKLQHDASEALAALRIKAEQILIAKLKIISTMIQDPKLKYASQKQALLNAS